MKISNFYHAEYVTFSIQNINHASWGNTNVTLARNFLQVDTSVKTTTVRKHIVNAIFLSLSGFSL